MIPPATPANESARLAALRASGLLDSPPEQGFDDIATLAAEICRTPIGLISLIDRHRQWFKARTGLQATETPREISFCGHAICQPDELMVVPNALEDPRFADNPLVTGEPNIRFYAGMPLRDENDFALGTICVIDRIPREISDGQRQALAALSRQFSNLLSLRRMNGELAEQMAARKSLETRLREHNAELRTVIEQVEELVISLARNGAIVYLNQAAIELLGPGSDEFIGSPVSRYLEAQSAEPFARAMEDASLHGRPQSLDVQLRSADGTPVRAAATISRRLGSDADTLHVILRPARSAPAVSGDFACVCAWCKKMRDDDAQWISMEEYFRKHHDVRFSHSICEECSDKLSTIPDFGEDWAI